MSCTKVLHVFGGQGVHESMLPMKLATHLENAAHHSLWSYSALKPHHTHHNHTPRQPNRSFTLLRAQSSSSSASFSKCSFNSSDRQSGMGCSGTTHKKKKVVFADSRGLSLTSVHVYSADLPDDGLTDSPLSASSTAQLKFLDPGSRWRPQLGFPQPSADYSSFHARLEENLVQLEDCSVTERVLSGTVRVCNVSLEKRVCVRVTFDSWRSHHDIPCTHLWHLNGGSSTDIFSFCIPLPANLDTRERLEFCIFFWPDGCTQPLWDNNRGQNYRILVEAVNHGCSPPPPTRKGTQIRIPQKPGTWPRTNPEFTHIVTSIFVSVHHDAVTLLCRLSRFC
uniref:CBM21 domain-containing protein n=1 Tax=Denticeps clupeoides TaxID=299321 RepID=A0AAY4B0B4_9TELE